MSQREYLHLFIQRESDRFKMTPLMSAALTAARETVSTLLSLGVDVDVVDAYGKPALYGAIRSGDTGTVEMLCNQTHSGKTEIAALLLPCCTFIFVKFYIVILFTVYRVKRLFGDVVRFNKRQHK